MGANDLFTTREAASLAEATPSAVEKAIEEGIVEVRRVPTSKAGARRRRLLSAAGVYYVAFLRNCDLQFSKKHKRRLWNCLMTTPSRRLLKARWHFSPGVDICPGELLGPTHERLSRYARARHRWIEANPDIKGATPVIRGTRLSVYAIAGRIDHGDTIEDIAAENSDLPREAFDAALLYARANPLVGRPGGTPWRH